MHRRLSALILICVAGMLQAQMPDTELWLFKIDAAKTATRLTDPINITKRPGYDNQPSFSADGKKLFYVSVRDDKQADVYYYDLKKKKNIQLTKTSISEYSPGETSDGKLLASVVVESDSAQRIHYINPLNGLHENKLEPDSVGYCTFLNADTVVYYKLTEPHSLRFFIPATGEDKWLGNAPGRAFKALNRHTLLYALKDSLKVTFYTYNFLLQRAQRYAEYAGNGEDMAWHPAWGLVKSDGARLMRYDAVKKEWLLLFDLTSFNLKKITRFAFDPKNKYLVVAENL